jgi:hypothetical protein
MQAKGKKKLSSLLSPSFNDKVNRRREKSFKTLSADGSFVCIHTFQWILTKKTK